MRGSYSSPDGFKPFADIKIERKIELTCSALESLVWNEDKEETESVLFGTLKYPVIDQ